MRKFIILLIGVSVLSCQSTKTGMTKEEFKTEILSVEKFNITENKLADGWYETLSTENEFLRFDKKLATKYFINPKPVVLPENFNRGEDFENNQGFNGVAIYFDNQGIDAWSKATNDNIGSHLIFILDNEILTSQQVNAQISNGASAFWRDDLTENQWEKIKKMIKK